MRGSDGDEVVCQHFATHVNSTENVECLCKTSVDEDSDHCYVSSLVRERVQAVAEGNECRWFSVSGF